MNLDRLRELSGIAPVVDTRATLTEAAKVGGYQKNFKNPAAKKRTGEKAVEDTEDYVVFHNRSFDEFRAVLKMGTKADGEMKPSKSAAVTAIKAAKESLDARFAKVEDEDDGDEYGNKARREDKGNDRSDGAGGRYERNTADYQGGEDRQRNQEK